MERIGVVGLNWRSGGPERIARFTLPLEERGERLPRLARALGARELVYLATCNRVEVAFVCDEPRPALHSRKLVFRELTGAEPAPGEAEQAMRAWEGEGAVEHLFLVATGLDSAKLGETEVTGQVRDALALGQEQGLVGPRLELLFREALKLAKVTRQRTGLGEGRTSLAEIALDFVRQRLGERPGSVALLGVSPMTERCGLSLAAEGVDVVLVNRTLERAEELAAKLGGRVAPVSLEEFRTAPGRLSALVSATGAPGTVLGERELLALSDRNAECLPLLVDLAIPPDIAPSVAESLGYDRVGMEEVLAAAEHTRAERVLEAGEARSLVDEAVLTFSQRLAERAVEQAVRSLHESYQATAADQVERLLRAKLRTLGPADQELLKRFVTRLASHFAHVPSTGLRELARDHGVDAVQRFFARADAELRQGLERGLEAGDAFAALGEELTKETLE